MLAHLSALVVLLLVMQVVLHAISSSTTATAGGEDDGLQFPLPVTPGLAAQLLLVAARLALVIDRYTEAVGHLKSAVRMATDADTSERWDHT